jgi:CubicO group peptidase (beta-lactamase class C family)
MQKTGYVLPEYEQDELAQGYRRGRPWGTVLGRPMLADGPCWNLRANGGIHSTLGDMYRWHRAISGEELLHGEFREAYFAPHMREGNDPSFYAYGWAVFETRRETRLIAHNGGNGIFSADFHRYVDEDLMLFVTSNRSEFPISLVSRLIAKAVFDEDPSLPPSTVDLSEEELRPFVGSYALEKGGEIQISLEAGRLQLTAEGDQASTSLCAASPYFFISYDIRGGEGLGLVFSEDARSLLLRRGDTEVPASRR